MKVYYINKTGFIEFFLRDKGESNYADYAGPNDEITVFHSEKTDDVIGYAIEDIEQLSLIDIPLEDKLAIVVKRLRKIKNMTQKEFVAYLNKQAGRKFISFRNYQRIESSDNSGSIGLNFLSTFVRLFPNENWHVLFPDSREKKAA